MRCFLSSEMAGLGDWLDAYERTARLVPALLAAAPVLVVVLAVGLRNDPVIVGLLSLVAAVGVPVAVANFVRDRGQQLQVALWARWRGSPTVALVRTAAGADALRDSRRRNLERVARGYLPRAAEERNDSAGSDQRYEAAIRALITRTRERPKFELVFKENQGYGYWRNLLGIRLIGRTTSAASAIVLALLFWARDAPGLHFGVNALDVLVGELAVILCLAFWIWAPAEDRVKRAAYAYAERLLDAAGLVQ
jgi:hypothetical protein